MSSTNISRDNLVTRTGASKVLKGNYVSQDMDEQPVKVGVNLSPRKTVKKQDNRIISVDSIHDTEVKETYVPDTRDDKIAAEVTKNIEDNGLKVLSNVFLSMTKNGDPEIYYEVMSPTGDIFLIYVKDYDNAKTKFYPGESKEVVDVSGKVFTYKNPSYESCANNVACSTFYDCNEDTQTCSRIENDTEHYNTRFQKVYTPECTKGECHMSYGDRTLALPVFTYYEFLDDPKKVIMMAGEQIIKIQEVALKTNLDTVKHSQLMFNIMSTMSKELFEGYESVSASNKTTNDKIQKFFTDFMEKNKGSVLSAQNQENYDELIRRKYAAKKLTGKLIHMVDNINVIMNYMDKSVDMVVKDSVELWLQSRLALDETKSGVWQLPTEVQNMTVDEVENLVIGNKDKLMEYSKAFVEYNAANLKKMKAMFLDEKESEVDDVTVDELQSLSKSSSQGISGDGDLLKLFYRIKGLIYLNHLIDRVSDKIQEEIDMKMNSGGVCKSKSKCLNINKKTNQITLEEGGNLAAYSQVSPPSAEGEKFDEKVLGFGKFNNSVLKKIEKIREEEDRV